MSLGSITTQYLTDIANAIRAKLGVATTYKPSQMAAAIDSIPSSTPTLQTKTKTYTPTTSQQTDTITPDAGYDGLDEVDITVNAVATGTAGTPTATKGTVSGHAVTVTPSVTNTTGYITGGTITGTGVSVSASELVSGTKSISANGTGIDVANYAAVDVAVPGATLTTKSITANGTYNASADSADGYSSVTVNVSGGASNVITGTFTTSSTTGAAASLTLPYTGSGYPIAAVFFVDGGAYNSESGNTWYNLIQRYAVGMWSMSKAATTTTPTYTSSGAQNQGVVQWIYKNSTSSYSTYNRSSVMNANSYSSSNATAQAQTIIRFKSPTSLSYFVASTSYGLVANMKYRYVIAYSS